MACDVLSISATCFGYQAQLSDENAVIADWLLRLTTTHKRWGFGLCFMFLRNSKGFHWNHKRVYRIYRDLELNLRIKLRKRIKRDKPEALSVPSAIHQAWSMDFMSDSLKDGRSVHTFNVIDGVNRECLTIDVNFSLPTQRVICSLERITEWRGKPSALRCDNEPEYISQDLCPLLFGQIDQNKGNLSRPDSQNCDLSCNISEGFRVRFLTPWGKKVLYTSYTW
jgi:putative transposase